MCIRDRQGDILVSLDKTDATIALNKAKNNLANIVRQTNKLYLQDKQYSAEVASARIQYQQSLEDYNRRVPLAKQGVISKETLEHTKDTLISSKAALNAAIQAYKANKALVMNTPLNRQPQVVEAADATKEAWLALKRTDIKSPVTGYIALSYRHVKCGLMPTLKKHNSRMCGLVNRSILSAIFMVKMLCFMVG